MDAGPITVTTLASSYDSYHDGTGGPDGTAGFWYPTGTAPDTAGNVYVSDNVGVRKIDAAGNVTTVAATGNCTFVDGGDPYSTTFCSVADVALGSQGDIYVADSYDNRIKKLDPTSGAITTIAGNYYNPFADGTGGPTGTAGFASLQGLVLDSSDNVYVTDWARVRRIDGATGVVTTVAGNGGLLDGTGGPDGTAMFNSLTGGVLDGQGNLYVEDTSCIRKIDSSGNVTTVAGSATPGLADGTTGAAGTATFDAPIGIAIDSEGKLYVGDANSVRKIDLVAGVVTTIAGGWTPGYADGTGGAGGTAQFDSPGGLAIDSHGNVYVADTYNARIRRIDAMSGQVTTVAGNGTSGSIDGTGGPQGSAELANPLGLAIDAQGNVFVAESGFNRVRRIDATSGNVTTVAGNGTYGFLDGTGGRSGTAEFENPKGVAVDAQGNLYVSDANNARVRKIAATSGQVTTWAGNGTPGFADGTGGPTGMAEFSAPNGIAVDGQGNVYVVDAGNGRIRRIDPTQNVTTVAGNGRQAYADGTGGLAGTAAFGYLNGIGMAADGTLYVSDYGNSRVRKIDVLGNVTTFAGNGAQGSVDGTGGATGTAEFLGPAGVAIDSAGNVYVGDNGTERSLTAGSRLRKINSSGQVTTFAGNGSVGMVDGAGGPTGTAEFNGLQGIAVDASGTLYLADQFGSDYYALPGGRIRKVDSAGNVTSLAGNGGFHDGTIGPSGTAAFLPPSGFAVDTQGALDFVETGSNRIRSLDRAGNMTTLAGNGMQGFVDGSGGANGTAEFWLEYSAEGLAVDGQGNIYVADEGNDRIRKVSATSGQVTTLAGNGTYGSVNGTGGPNGTAEFESPSGVAVGGPGHVYVADGQRIRDIDSVTGQVVLLAGNGQFGNVDGPAGLAEFGQATGIAVDAQLNVYVADEGNNSIRKIDANGKVTTLAGNGTAGFKDGTGGATGAAEFNEPSAVAVDAVGNVYVVDDLNYSIRKVSPQGVVTTLAGNGQPGYVDGLGGRSGLAQFTGISSVAVGLEGEIYVSDGPYIRVIHQ